MKRVRRQTGVTLIEVLVTLVILSIALSGIAAVQATSMQSASQIKFRSAAMSSAQSMLDSMRTNRNGNSAAGLASLQSYVGTQASTPSANTQVGQDYIAFKAQLEASLINRNAVFEIKVDPNRLVTIDIQWDQRKGKEKGTEQKTYTVSAYL